MKGNKKDDRKEDRGDVLDDMEQRQSEAGDDSQGQYSDQAATSVIYIPFPTPHTNPVRNM